MTEKHFVKLPNGEILTRSDLPEEGQRWTIFRKMRVVQLIEHEIVTELEVCQRYNMTDDEIAGWRARFSEAGRAGLKVYRNRETETRKEMQ